MKPRREDVPRNESLKVCNYRSLRELELRNLRPPTVFVGPNGNGKSTLFDVFAFLSECCSTGLRKAWDRRGRLKELLNLVTGIAAFTLEPPQTAL